MKRFVFPLARLERLRDVKRREARTRLLDALGEAREREREREERERALEESLTVRLPDEIASTARGLQQLSSWRDGQRFQVQQAATAEIEAREAASVAGEEHAEAARDHRVMERLRERRHRRWLHEMQTEERKFLDEIHQLRLVRQRHEMKEKE